MDHDITNAITLLSEYCGSRSCRYCHLRMDTVGCLFSCGYPYQWAEIMKELDKEKADE